MRLIDVINAPWAITPDLLAEIQEIYVRHMRGEKIDIKGLEAKLGAPLNNEPKGYEVQDGVAVLPIDGVIAKRMNLFSQISGGVSSQLVMRDFHAAMNDQGVVAIVLAIDSGGGTVDGTQELAQAIHAARGIKPILTHSDGMLASAAYWIGAAADKITVSSNNVIVGSIGIVTKHVDVSQAEARMGFKTTEISSGKYKRIASSYAPLSAEGLATIQADLDYVYSNFVDDIAQFRGTTPDDVLMRMADGRTFRGQQAIDNGLVDGVATLAETIEQARAMARSKSFSSRAGSAAAKTEKEKHMNLETLKAEHPELVQAIVAEATAGLLTKEQVDEALAVARQAGADLERQRIAAVREQLIPGHEALIEQLAMDGKTCGHEAAAKVLAAEKALREQNLAAIKGGGSTVVPDAAAPVVDAAASGGTAEDRARAEWDKDEKLRAEFGGKFESFLAYASKAAAGKARIFKQ